MKKRQQSNDTSTYSGPCGRVWTTVSVMAGLGVFAATGCLQINHDHCVANGGDWACGGETPWCVMSLGQEPELSREGCAAEEDAPVSSFAHVKYGLPSRLGVTSDESLDTVAGVLHRAAGCEPTDAALQEISGVFDDLSDRVLKPLDGRSRADAGFVIDGDVIKEFNDAVDAWACESSGTETETGTDTTAATETTQSTESGTETTGERPPCETNKDCIDDMDALFCETMSGECVNCDGMPDPDAACMAVSQLMPVCEGGTCVQCTEAKPGACVNTKPVCNDANACVGCTEHDQCGEAACNFYTGACLTGEVVHVGPGLDYPGLTEAVASFAADAEGTIIVHQDVYNDTILVDGGRVLAFLTNEGDLPTWDDGGGNSNPPQLLVTDGTVFLDGLVLSGNTNTAVPALRVTGGRAWVDRSHVVTNSGGAIIAASGGNVTLRNCFVGGDFDDVNAVEINAASATVVYSTLVAGTFNASAMFCSSPVGVVVSNSLIAARGNLLGASFDVTCDEADITFTATETMFPGRGNQILGQMPSPPLPQEWFVNVVDDLHLDMPPNAIATTARWSTGDPAVDIDGDARPAVDGMSDYAGADVP